MDRAKLDADPAGAPVEEPPSEWRKERPGYTPRPAKAIHFSLSFRLDLERYATPGSDSSLAFKGKERIPDIRPTGDLCAFNACCVAQKRQFMT